MELSSGHPGSKVMLLLSCWKADRIFDNARPHSCTMPKAQGYLGVWMGAGQSRHVADLLHCWQKATGVVGLPEPEVASECPAKLLSQSCDNSCGMQ